MFVARLSSTTAVDFGMCKTKCLCCASPVFGSSRCDIAELRASACYCSFPFIRWNTHENGVPRTGLLNPSLRVDRAICAVLCARRRTHASTALHY
eukprot:1189876-Prorocentrum_minimum.AAC.5